MTTLTEQKGQNRWKIHVCSSRKTTFTIFEANVQPATWWMQIHWSHFTMVTGVWHPAWMHTRTYSEFKRNMVQLTQWRQPLF